MSDRWVRLISTFFYIGEIPLAPGSMATAAATLLAFFLHDSVWMYLSVLAIVTVLGFRVSGRMEEIKKQKDPSCIVIDEVAGCLIAFFLLPFNAPVVWTTFFLFRAFDMFKIYPVNRFEEKEAATGIMMDDIVAGIYTNLTMQIAVRLAGMI